MKIYSTQKNHVSLGQHEFSRLTKSLCLSRNWANKLIIFINTYNHKLTSPSSFKFLSMYSNHTTILFPKQNQGVFVKHYAPGDNKVQKAIFSFNVKVKVTRSLTLVSFERASLVEYSYPIWSLYLSRFKSNDDQAESKRYHSFTHIFKSLEMEVITWTVKLCIMYRILHVGSGCGIIATLGSKSHESVATCTWLLYSSCDNNWSIDVSYIIINLYSTIIWFTHTTF